MSAARISGSPSQHGQATPSVVAVVSVIAVAAAMVAFFFVGSAGQDTSTEATAQMARSEPPESPTAEPTPTSADNDTSAREDTKAEQGKREQRKDRQRKRDRSEPKSRPEPAPDVPDVYIEVYNNTAISGLAASTAARLQDGGWQVVGVDNWHGNIPASTVYYPDGMSDEANQLAQALGIERVWGAVSPMKFDRLTVILTPDAA